MIDVSLTYDPISLENRSITINGKKLPPNTELGASSKKMLQSWIASFPEMIEKQIAGERTINLEFTGTVSDQQDVQAMVDRARSSGYTITVEYNTLPAPEELFQDFQEWLAEQEEKPFFRELLEKNPDKRHALEEAMGARFDVFVIATMSAGKSTLINAFLRRELAPSANEATTAVITEIHNAPSSTYKGKASAEDKAKELYQSDDVTLPEMERWNRQEAVRTISLEGPLPFVKNEQDLNIVLTDTPGPNNSRDQQHGITTMEKIHDNKHKPLILYVLNAQQLGINDDKSLLKEISEAIKDDPQARDRFLFVLNKADVFDPEKENLGRIVGNCRSYLQENGIEDPFIYPVSAQLALLARKDAGALSRLQKDELRKLERQFIPDPEDNWPGLDFGAVAPTTFSVQSKEENDLVRRSGIAALEAAIKGYARKYNYPSRLVRAATVARDVLDIAKGEEDLQQAIASERGNIKELNRLAAIIKERSNEVWKAQDSLDELETLKKMPEGYLDTIKEKRVERQTLNRKIRERLEGVTEPADFKEEMDTARKEVTQFFEGYIALLNRLIQGSQNDVEARLKYFYERKIDALFEGLDQGTVSRPVLEGMGNMALNLDLNLQSNEITKEAREISASRWYNPFSWFSTETVYDQKIFDAGWLWDQRCNKVIEPEFEAATNKVEKLIEHGRAAYVQLYVERVETMLPQKIDQLNEQLSQYAGDKAGSEQRIAEAEERLEEIGGVRERLEATLQGARTAAQA